MRDNTLVDVHLNAGTLPAAAAWADGLQVKMPAELAPLFEEPVSIWNDAGAKALAKKAAINLRERSAYLSRPPGSARLPVSYRSVPGPLRRMIARGIGRVQRARQSKWADFPGWPIDLSADVAADLCEVSTSRSGRTPVLLTHDIDSPEGLENLVRLFLPIEEKVGARSANYVVPHAWPLDKQLLREVQVRGHEIGVHGYDHSNRTPFMQPAQRKKRIAEGALVGSEFGSVGFSAPSLVRSRELIQDLAAHYRYDSSIPTSGGFLPVPNNGCASARPWQIGDIWELPLSMPRDGSLRFLGYSPSEIEAMWTQSADLVAQSGGVVVLLTHCERGFSGNPPMLAAYRSFVDAVAHDRRFEFMRPVDLIMRLEQQLHDS